MKRALLFILLCSIVFTGTALAVQSDHGNIGVGVVLGIPTGASGKFWILDRSALDLALGWNFELGWFATQGGYIFHFPIQDVTTGSLAGYVGAGGVLEVAPPSDDRIGDKINLSGRVPIGLEYIYTPISFFVEIDPLLVFYPGIAFDFGGGVGFRFYF